MDNLVRLFPSTEAAQHTGRVVSTTDDHIEVDVGGRAWEATRAFPEEIRRMRPYPRPVSALQ